MKGSLTPFTLTFTSSTGGSAELDDVLFGDVTLCSGQSNMVFTVAQVKANSTYCTECILLNDGAFVSIHTRSSPFYLTLTSLFGAGVWRPGGSQRGWELPRNPAVYRGSYRCADQQPAK